MSKKEIAATLKRLREESKLTADEVGAKIGKSGKTVNAWENGRGQPDADILVELCKIYKVNNILAEFNSSLKNNLALNVSEQNIIKKYRAVPPHSKEIVETILDKEYDFYTQNNIDGYDAGKETTAEKVYNIKIAARNGEFKETTITESELQRIKNLPDAEEF